MATHRNIRHEVGVTHSNAVVRGRLVRLAYHLHPLTNLIRDSIPLQGSGSHLRPFGIHQDGDAVRDLAYIGDELVEPLAREVSRVHTHYVHARIEQAADKLHITALVRNRSDNFRLFQLHNTFPFSYKNNPYPIKTLP